MANILVVDPQRSVRNALKERLEFEDYHVTLSSTLKDAYELHEKTPFEIVIIDGMLADTHLQSEDRGRFSNASPIILSNSPSIEAAISAIREGAFDFVAKPVDINRLLNAIRGVVAYTQKLDTEPRAAAASPQESRVRNGKVNRDNADGRVEDIIGESTSINHVKSLIDKVAPSGARVLITGPNGTGKELVARWLHEKSGRSEAPFIEVNCAAIPSELIESELFGHEKGAFTSAIKQRKGKFEQAHGGTLFLDEIGDMSAAAQAKVLRALQEKKICRVGSDKDIDVDVRVVAATNKNLREEIEKGTFREDLYHRLSVIVINCPALIDRIDDIPVLVDYFVKKICADYGIADKVVEEEAVLELMSRDWTGNIRELRNVVERLIILSGGDNITTSDVRAYAL